METFDDEIAQRLQTISSPAADPWEGFCPRCRAYLEIALEPEFQRIVLRDAKAVLGGSSPESQRHCVESVRCLIRNLIPQGVVEDVDPEGLALLICGSLTEAAF